EFLSDVQGELLDALDIRRARRSMTGKDTAIPTTYLLDRAGVVRWVYRAERWRGRPHPQEALDAIRALSVPAPAEAAQMNRSYFYCVRDRILLSRRGGQEGTRTNFSIA